MSYPLVATRKGVFAHMSMIMETDEQYRNISPYVRRNFSLLRTHAEELVEFQHRNDTDRNTSISQIYSALLMTGELTKAEAEEIMLLEDRIAKELYPLDISLQEECIDRDISWLKEIEDDFSAQLLAGAAKSAVSKHDLIGPARIGAFWGGPILMPYVEWLLRRSEALGFKRLYFIARDGYILKIMADALIEVLGLNIETYYIHGSRKAWRMPSYLGREGELQSLIGWSYPPRITSAEILADILGLPVEELRGYLLPEYREKNQFLNPRAVAACALALDKSREFRNLLKGRLTEKRQLVVDYLQQEIDTSDDAFAFVELGGGGFTQVCLSRIMQEFYDGSIRTFFYKLDKIYDNDNNCVFYDFFPSKLKNDLLVEMVCRAPEGQTEGYTRQGDRVVPIKKSGEKELYIKHGYGKYVDGIKAFTDAYRSAVSKYKSEPGLKASFVCMNALAELDDEDITDYFASMPNRVTGREENVPEFAPPLSKQQIQDIFIRYGDGVNGTHYHGTDFSMSLKRSTPYIQGKVKKYQTQAWNIRNRWANMFPQVRKKYNLETGGYKGLPYSMLGKRVVLYGAGVRGKRWYKDLSDDKALEIVQWLDKGYLQLKEEMPVNGDMESLGQVDFDWLMVDFANAEILASVVGELQKRGVPQEKIYTPKRISDWISSWENYLHVL